MKSFKEFLEEVKKPTGDLKKACWKGYTAVGTKEKNGRTVPNCVPEEVGDLDIPVLENEEMWSQQAIDAAAGYVWLDIERDENDRKEQYNKNNA